MKAVLVSRRFNPGHVSHIEANARLLLERGFDVRLRLHEKFHAFHDFGSMHKSSLKCSQLFLERGDFFIVWFPSLLALLNVAFVRAFTAGCVVYVYHEPFTSVASYRKAGFSSLQVLRIWAVSRVSRLTCSLSHKVILPSSRAFDAMPAAKADSAKYARFNLFFSDEAGAIKPAASRPYVSYIGTVAEDHAFEEFVNLVHECVARDLLGAHRFLIATRSQIPRTLADKIAFCESAGRLVVVSGRPLPVEEINDFYSQSFVVWNAYRRSMQSGVLPKAYMFGSPVIASSAGSNEFCADGVHGVFISDKYSTAEFVEAISRLDECWDQFSRNCREFYLRNFDYRAHSDDFMEFLTSGAA